MKKVFLFITISFLFACKHLQHHFMHATSNSIQTVDVADRTLSFKNGYWYYAGNLFSGTIIERFNSKAIHQTTQYSNGKENGWRLTYYLNGDLSENRFYTNGEKDNVHTGWWQNGNKRFEYNFTNGVYNGDYKEWYQSGRLLKHIHYTNSTDDWGKGWRESGKLYMNYVMKDGRRYGIVNSNLCYTVKNDKGEYVKSSPN